MAKIVAAANKLSRELVILLIQPENTDHRLND